VCYNSLLDLDSHGGNVTLVLLPLKYEIDDSVTVTVVLLGSRVGALCAYGRDIGLQVRQKPTSKI